LRFKGLQYTDTDITDFEERLGRIYDREFGKAMLDLDITGALQFQIGRVRRRMSWREFILGMGLHTAKEIESVGFGAYWAESARQIPDKGNLSTYWIGFHLLEISLAQPRPILLSEIRCLGCAIG
ncbi:hypothetical protein Tco_1578830, partial [Tanacetum coccineum]